MNEYLKKELRSEGLERYYFTDVEGIMLSNRKGYSEYQKEFAMGTKLNTISKPQYIVMEVNNYCNMRCKMCTKSMYDEANGKDNISINVLEKFLRDANEMGVPSFFLGGMTECLINPQIKKILGLIREIGQGIDDVLITNGYELTPEIADLLIDLQWEKVFISLDAATPEAYHKIRGCDLERVERNVNYLIKRKKDRKSLFPLIRVSFVVQPDNECEKDMFIKKWGGKVDMIDFQPLLHYEDMTVKCDLPMPNRVCDSPFIKLALDCHGNMYPCCNEWSHKLMLGNIKNMSLQEIWNGTKIKELRRQMMAKCMCDVCKSCIFSSEA